MIQRLAFRWRSEVELSATEYNNWEGSRSDDQGLERFLLNTAMFVDFKECIQYC